jgi:pyruvate/2-oxoglutarate dehydrogenase complex dihydrolipoamide acyltransferase (E2) component
MTLSPPPSEHFKGIDNMVTRFKIKWLGEGEGVLSQWFFEDGGAVQEGDVLCEVMQDKVITEVSAPTSGKLEVLSAEDDELESGQTLGYILCD